jgi:hypothetical protein
VAAALALPAAALAVSAAAVSPVPGGVYKGKLENQPDNVRLKVGDSGERGRFTLQCAGVRREGFRITDGTYRVVERAGGERVFEARGRFVSKTRTRGQVVSVRESGATCGKDLFKARLR